MLPLPLYEAEEIREAKTPTDLSQLSGEEFLLLLDVPHQVYRDAYTASRQANRNLLSDESVQEFMKVYYPDTTQDGRRDRTYIARIERQTREFVYTTISSGKYNAQASVLSDHEGTLADVETFKAQCLMDLAPGSTASELEKLTSTIWLTAFETERQRCLAEQELRSYILEYTKSSPEKVIEFIKAIMSDEIDVDEYRPLLSVLYKDADDQNIDGIILGAINHLNENNELFIPVFLSYYDEALVSENQDEQADQQFVKPETVEWIRFIHSHPDIGMQPSKLFGGIDLENWPDSLREQFEAFTYEYLRDTWTSYVAFLKDFKQQSIYVIPHDHIGSIIERMNDKPSPKKTKQKKKQKGPRITNKVRPNEYIDTLELEEAPLCQTVALAVKSERGWITTDTMAVNGQLSIEEARMLKPVSHYLSDYQSSPDIENDLLAMLNSIIAQPYSNGAEKMSQMEVTFPVNGHRRRFAVWHLNPNKRSDMSIGDVGRKTRIYYAVLPDESGGKQLALLDVGNKNTTEQLGGFFRKT